jgi:hypothetical protein
MPKLTNVPTCRCGIALCRDLHVCYFSLDRQTRGGILPLKEYTDEKRDGCDYSGGLCGNALWDPRADWSTGRRGAVAVLGADRAEPHVHLGGCQLRWSLVQVPRTYSLRTRSDGRSHACAVFRGYCLL